MRKFNENQPEQRTADWHRARLGHFTGSQIVKLMGTGRKKEDVFSATAISYIFQVASERLLSEKVVEDDEMFWLVVIPICVVLGEFGEFALGGLVSVVAVDVFAFLSLHALVGSERRLHLNA